MKSESIKEITAALAKAQIAFLPIKRTEKVGYETKGGSKKYNYAPLDVVLEATRKALSDNGLAVTQSTYLTRDSIILETLLSHSSGEWQSGELYVGKQELAPQTLGSALTYMRRYGYSSMLCVSSEEDDDGLNASKEKSSSTYELPVLEKSTPVVIAKESQPLTPQELYEIALSQKTGVALCNFAKEHGYTNEALKVTLGVSKPSDIKNAQVAAVVLFPKPAEKEVMPSNSSLVDEALKLGAREIEEGGK